MKILSIVALSFLVQTSYAANLTFVKTDRKSIFAIEKAGNSEKTFAIGFNNGYGCGKASRSCSDYLNPETNGFLKTIFWNATQVDSGKSDPFINPDIERKNSVRVRICIPHVNYVGIPFGTGNPQSAEIEQLTCDFQIESLGDPLSVKVVKDPGIYTIHWTKTENETNQENSRLLKVVEDSLCDSVIEEKKCHY